MRDLKMDELVAVSGGRRDKEVPDKEPEIPTGGGETENPLVQPTTIVEVIRTPGFGATRGLLQLGMYLYTESGTNSAYAATGAESGNADFGAGGHINNNSAFEGLNSFDDQTSEMMTDGKIDQEELEVFVDSLSDEAKTLIGAAITDLQISFADLAELKGVTGDAKIALQTLSDSLGYLGDGLSAGFTYEDMRQNGYNTENVADALAIALGMAAGSALAAYGVPAYSAGLVLYAGGAVAPDFIEAGLNYAIDIAEDPANALGIVALSQNVANNTDVVQFDEQGNFDAPNTFGLPQGMFPGMNGNPFSEGKKELE